MLDLTDPGGPPVHPARALAKVRGGFASLGLDARRADATRDATGDPDTAAKLAPTIRLTMERADAAKLSLDEAVAILGEVLADPEATDPSAVASLARDRLMAGWMAKGDADAPMHGAPTARIGTSWDSPEGFRARMVAGLSARLDPKGAVGREGAQRLPDLLRLWREIPREDYRPAKALALSASAMPPSSPGVARSSTRPLRRAARPSRSSATSPPCPPSPIRRW